MGDTIERGGAESLLLINDILLYVGLTRSDDPTYEEAYSDILKTDTLGNMILQRRLIDDGFPPNSTIKSSSNKILVIGTYYVDGNWDIYLWKMNADLEDDTLYNQPITYDSLCPYQILPDTVDLNCSLFVNIEDIPTKEEYESTIKISPNPARDWITITLPDNVTTDLAVISIYNIMGQEVLKKVVPNNGKTFSLDISSLPQGIYIAIYKDKRNRILSGKFIKALY